MTGDRIACAADDDGDVVGDVDAAAAVEGRAEVLMWGLMGSRQTTASRRASS